MDWTKVDAGLAGALGDGDGDRFVVFVHLAPGADSDVCLGPEDVSAAGTIRSATLSRQEIERLTDQAAVRHIRLSGTLRTAEDA